MAFRNPASVARLAPACFALALASPWASAQNAFTDVTAAAGVEFHHEGDPNVPIGAGAAWIDVDNDGDDDLYAIQAVGCNRLYRNDGNGNFTEILDAAGASDCGSLSHGVGAADADNDGDQDLHVSNMGQNRFYKNMLVETGSLQFEDATVAAGFDGDGGFNSSSAVWGDYDNDGNLDLFVGNHAIQMNPISCFEDYLWHNNGDGTFTNVGAETGIARSGVLDKPGCALAATFSDYDNDGDADLMVINDFGNSNQVPNRLFRNDGPAEGGNWTFTDISAPSGFNYAQAGMGIAIGDLDRNGLFDYYMSDAGPNELGYNNGDDTFTNLAPALGVEASDEEIWGWLGLVSWGNGFFDIDLDGWEDLAVCNGGGPQDKYPGMFGGAEYIQLNPCYVYRNRWEASGRFFELHQQLGVTTEKYYRGIAFADYDEDGDIDMHFGNLQGYNTLYRNDMQLGARHWLKVKATGTLGNRDAIGARLRVVAGGVSQMREIDGGSSFMSRNSLKSHIGLGSATQADLYVTFPSGVTQEYVKLAVDRTVNTIEPRITSVFAADQVTVAEGSPVVVNVTFTNHTAQARQRDVWLIYIPESGPLSVIGGPIPLNFQPMQSFTRPIRIPITADQPPTGPRLVGVRLGSYPNIPTHRDHITVDIVPAQ